MDDVEELPEVDNDFDYLYCESEIDSDIQKTKELCITANQYFHPNIIRV